MMLPHKSGGVVAFGNNIAIVITLLMKPIGPEIPF
jgi:hypothetical protein